MANGHQLRSAFPVYRPLKALHSTCHIHTLMASCTGTVRSADSRSWGRTTTQRACSVKGFRWVKILQGRQFSHVKWTKSTLVHPMICFSVRGEKLGVITFTHICSNFTTMWKCEQQWKQSGTQCRVTVTPATAQKHKPKDESSDNLINPQSMLGSSHTHTPMMLRLSDTPVLGGSGTWLSCSLAVVETALILTNSSSAGPFLNYSPCVCSAICFSNACEDPIYYKLAQQTCQEIGVKQTVGYVGQQHWQHIAVWVSFL